jgi:hypothetical protein
MVKNEAYAWALKEARESRSQKSIHHVSVEDWARRATERFGVPVIGNSLRHKLRKGNNELQNPGPSSTIGDE